MTASCIFTFWFVDLLRSTGLPDVWDLEMFTFLCCSSWVVLPTEDKTSFPVTVFPTFVSFFPDFSNSVCSVLIFLLISFESDSRSFTYVLYFLISLLKLLEKSPWLFVFKIVVLLAFVEYFLAGSTIGLNVDSCLVSELSLAFWRTKKRNKINRVSWQHNLT